LPNSKTFAPADAGDPQDAVDPLMPTWIARIDTPRVELQEVIRAACCWSASEPRRFAFDGLGSVML